MRIGLDFDRTLFDTDSFDDFYKDNVEGLYHVDSPAPVKHGVYDPEMHADLCGIPLERIWSVFSNDLSRFLYSDIDKIEEIKENHDVVIVTRGHEKFQKSKVEASGLADKVEDVIVVQEKSKDVADIDLLVDDRDYELEKVGIPGVKIDRPREGLEKVLERLKNCEA